MCIACKGEVGDSAENKFDSIRKNFNLIRFTGSGVGTGGEGVWQ